METEGAGPFLNGQDHPALGHNGAQAAGFPGPGRNLLQEGSRLAHDTPAGGNRPQGQIDDLLALLIANNNQWNRHWLTRLMLAFDTRLSRFSTLNFPDRSRRNVARNYDLKDSFFDTFLDP